MELSSNEFDYLFVLDFEAQCSDAEKLNCQEIIEFPVVVIDVKSKSISDKSFHYYVKPTVYPKLFSFCTELTGITQNKVDSGIELAQVLTNLDDFITQNFSGKKFTFVTCGDWDLKTCLKNEAKFKNIEYKEYLKHWINIKRIFADFVGSKRRVGMIEMLDDLEIPLVGRHHSGIDDAKNIAQIALKIMEGGKKFDYSYVTKERTKINI